MRGFDREARTFVRARGTTLNDARGRRLFDAVSSIWTIVHGHCHPAIAEAIARQARALDHSTTLGASNPRAEELADRLCALTGMDYAFFASDGSCAVEAAIKMALQYWQRAGEPQRIRFVHLTDAYHGDTTGAMSLSDIGLFKGRFASITFESRSYTDASAFESDVAAIIVEPVIQAAAGMRLVPPALFERLQGIEPLVIADEIATGFGRTGTMFACERAGLQPDIMCVGKGLTGGTLALSATLVRERIYAAFLGDPDERVQFFHGHSYAGNPLACAAALASLELFERERTLECAQRIARRIKRHLETLRAHPFVREARQAGTMTGIELRAEAIDRAGSPTPGWRVCDALYERGQFTRPLGDVVQLVPPLCSADERIDAFFEALSGVLAAL
jgi:adenosylmethionine-8-amino-7-oxononanoate aminotransferase